MRNYTNKLIAGIIIAAVLSFAFLYGGDTPAIRGGVSETRDSHIAEVTITPEENKPPESADKQETNKKAVKSAIEVKVAEKPAAKAESFVSGQKAEAQATEDKKESEVQTKAEKPVETSNNINLSEAQEKTLKGSSISNQVTNIKDSSAEQVVKTAEPADTASHHTDPIANEKPLPVEPGETSVSDKELTCTLSVRCDTILNNITWLDKEKVGLVPEDGIIFAEKQVSFYEGESVFNLLAREMKRNNIHLEFENTPIYNTAYIEGIANLYEFDCGELSGWMYKVNDRFPDYGCSRYQLKNGDRVEWVYTCDLGADVGGEYTSKDCYYE